MIDMDLNKDIKLQEYKISYVRIARACINLIVFLHLALGEPQPVLLLFALARLADIVPLQLHFSR